MDSIRILTVMKALRTVQTLVSLGHSIGDATRAVVSSLRLNLSETRKLIELL